MPRLDDDIGDVLLVDDNQESLMLLSKGLVEAGLRVLLAKDGEQALACVERDQPEAVLLDVIMPGMDGFETCRRIRATNENIPVIFMTGLGEAEHIVRGFEVGGTDYVTKPVSLPVVIARLQSHMRTARLVRATHEAISATGTAMLACDNRGRMLWCNESARELITGLVPDLVLSEGELIPAVLGISHEADSNADNMSRLIPFGDRCLEVTRATEPTERITVYLFKLANAQTARPRASPKLTERESEVLLWVARGKTNRDIADILGMSPRTVNKHLEHIFEKLGVETRTAAAAAAATQLGLTPTNRT